MDELAVGTRRNGAGSEQIRAAGLDAVQAAKAKMRQGGTAFVGGFKNLCYYFVRARPPECNDRRVSICTLLFASIP
jgi:hypothetical protein